MGNLADFLQGRAGLRTARRAWLDRPLPGGARFGHATCAALAVLIALQLLTGFVLALHYSPSVTTAWASIVFLEEKIQGGKLVRGLHVFGSSAIVIALLLHYIRVVFWGSYKKPRELTWAVGLLIAVVLAGFAVSGTLLPYDQNAFWATRVRVNLAGSTPLVGSTLRGVAQGGEDVGNLTLARFYAIHAVLLPGALLLLGGLRSRLKARHGFAPPPSVAEDAPAEPWYPGQAARNWLVAALVLGGLFVFVYQRGGAPLDAPADPASDYEARPEWFFLPLYQLVKYFPPQHAFLGTEVIPAAIFLALLALPFVDKGESRAPSKRASALALAFAPLVGAIGLGAVAASHDASNEHLHKSQARAADDARAARELFLTNGGIPPEGPLELYELDPVRVGKRVFREHCAACHSLDSRPGMKGPDLGHYLTPSWLSSVIRIPDDPLLFGKNDTMLKTDGKPAEIAALVDFVRSLESDVAARSIGEARVAAGKKAWEDKQCGACHDTKGTDSGEGPNLAGYGSDAWLVDFMKKPDEPRFYGKSNRMPSYADKLSSKELSAVIAYLKSPEVRERN